MLNHIKQFNYRIKYTSLKKSNVMCLRWIIIIMLLLLLLLLLLYFIATVFLEFWKRRRSILTYAWDLIEWEEEEVRKLSGKQKLRNLGNHIKLRALQCTYQEQSPSLHHTDEIPHFTKVSGVKGEADVAETILLMFS